MVLVYRYLTDGSDFKRAVFTAASVFGVLAVGMLLAIAVQQIAKKFCKIVSGVR